MKFIFCLFSLLLTFSGFSQQTDRVDFLEVAAKITPDYTTKSVKGAVKYRFKVLKTTDSIYLDAINMKIVAMPLEGMTVVASEEKIWLMNTFEPGKIYTVFFEYRAVPKQTLYFTENQIWTQGQGKYTSHWLPSLDDMTDKMEFDLTIGTQNDQTVIANGNLVNKRVDGINTFWSYNMDKPMPSYLVAFAIGSFDEISLKSASEVLLTQYIEKDDIQKVEPTYRHTKEIFDFLETEIGVAYPWQNYKQVPVRDFLYAGMENTTATFFSEAFVVDSIAFNDRNYVNVNAHELAHQWFGNLVTETEGKHHWLHEGFATYYALLAEKEIFGEDYYYWKLLQSAEQLKELSNEGKGQALLNAKASSLTFYEKGAWALHILKERIGEAAFKKAIVTYLNTYAFKNVTTEDFLAEVKAATPVDVETWKKDWLEQSAFKEEEAFQSLMKSSFISSYFATQALNTLPIAEKKTQLLELLSTTENDFIAQEVIYQLQGEPIAETLSIYKKGFETNNLYARQAIAITLEPIPAALKIEYEGLLTDDSYITKESAMFGLWRNFPENRGQYLEQMDRVIGFQDKNVRALWLALAIVTPEFRSLETADFKLELRSYTNKRHSFEIRERAFGYVIELQLFDEATIANLVNASTHHNWRFRNFSRNLLNTLRENPIYLRVLTENIQNYTEAEQQYLTKILKEK